MSNRHWVNWKGKSDKHKKACASYRNLNKRAENKKRTVARHCRNQPNDLQGKEVLASL